MFVFVAMLIFSVAMFAAAYYVWSVPEQDSAQVLNRRLREVRASAPRSRVAPQLLRRRERGAIAFLGDLVTWVGVLRRLQELIEQANLKYRAADVFGLSVLLFGGGFVLFVMFGVANLLLRLVLAAGLGVLPLAYILRIRTRRMRKF
jgi:hypothetical protein